MEYVIGAISLVSMILNYMIYRRITTTYVLGSVSRNFGFEPVLEACCCKNINPIESEPEEAYDPPVAVSQEAYSAWKNQKEIPWIPPTKAPEPIVKPPNRGPMARPDGFI